MTISTAVGFASVCLWVVAQVPQVLKNQQRRHTDDLSVHFLALWLAGDSCNLVGSVLIGGTPPQVVLGIYFVLSDIILLLQWWIFTDKSHPDDRPSTFKYLWITAVVLGVGALLHCLLHGLSGAAIGDICGWASGLIYVASRVPQIYHTCTSHHVEDLSILLFLCAVLGNATYAVSIFLHSLHPSWLRKQAPFLLGSMGTLLFDAILIGLIVSYRGRPAAVPDEAEPISPISP